ncbi:hypothetical protein ABIC33_006503 [Variovorax sp. 1140]
MGAKLRPRTHSPVRSCARALVGRDQAEARAKFHREVAQREARFDVERAHRLARELDRVAHARRRAQLADDVQRQVFRGDARAEHAVAADAHALRLLLAQRLRGQRVRALGRAHAEGQRAESSVGASVAVAADHGEARQHDAQFGPHHMDDALARLAEVVEAHAGVGAELGQRAVQPAAEREGVGLAVGLA